MNSCLDFYKEQAELSRAKDPWLRKLQDSALTDFLELNFPTRQDEDWKYTPLTSFLTHSFQLPQIIETVTSYQPHDYEVALINGEHVVSGDWRNDLPSGVLIVPIKEALETHPDLIQTYLGSVLKHTNGFHALNTAMMQAGVLIYIPSDTHVDQTLVLKHVQTTSGQGIHIRHLIILEEDSTLNLTEDYSGVGDSAYFTNTVTEIVLARGARLTHHKLQRETKKAYHVGQTEAQLSEDSVLDSHSLSFGGGLVRSDLTIHLLASNAQCQLNGVYFVDDGQHIDHHTLVNHASPECISEQDYKGILMGKSRAVFNGRVVVPKDAQKTQAKQQNKNLLLSAQAEVNTKPQLEIFADDVVCSHGATVGQLDPDALFYMTARGIEEDEAKRYLIEAFSGENLNRLQDKDVANTSKTLLSETLERGNA